MTREEIYNTCLDKFKYSKSLLMELATGTGKTRLAIMLVNHLCSTVFKGRRTSMLLLVAQNVHKQTWKEEFKKWGGIYADSVTIECYESLKKHVGESFDFLIMDECHHIKSETRMDLLSNVRFDYMIGLSATIPRAVKLYFQYRYHSQIVSCNLTEAIEDDILPEPKILLLPLELDDSAATETLEVNAKAKNHIGDVQYSEYWKWRNFRNHAIVHCTQKQKVRELDAIIQQKKNIHMRTHSKATENIWLYLCGKRLEYLAQCKNAVVRDILKKLRNQRTITFCKTIGQSEELGRNCIHSKNSNSAKLYEMFNNKEINHITAVNILNENANLVECKYAIFANISSSEVIVPQRLGRALRHKSPIILIPYFKDTREEEIVDRMVEGFNQKYVEVIHSIDEI